MRTTTIRIMKAMDNVCMSDKVNDEEEVIDIFIHNISPMDM